MELTGKKINFLGDSITQGAGASAPDTCYVADMERLYHLAAARNYGIGGTRIAHQKAVSAEPVWDQDFVGRYAQMDADADIVVVFGGTNDFGHGLAPFGQVGDTAPDTFCGACDTLYKGLKAMYPHAVLAVITPTPRTNEDSPKGEGNKPAGHILADYVDAIKQLPLPTGCRCWTCSIRSRWAKATNSRRSFSPMACTPTMKATRFWQNLSGNSCRPYSLSFSML